MEDEKTDLPILPVLSVQSPWPINAFIFNMNSIGYYTA